MFSTKAVNLANTISAAAATFNDAKEPLSLPLADFNKDLTINTTSAFVAAQQAALGFGELPDSASKTFIYTGNALNTMTMGPLMSLGVGKSATAHILQSAAAAYTDRGFKYVLSLLPRSFFQCFLACPTPPYALA